MGPTLNTATAEPQIEIFDDREAVTQAIAKKLLTVITETLDEQDLAHVSLTGGGAGIATLKAVADTLSEDSANGVEWSRVHFWWGDERLLPRDETDRNETQARQALLDTLVGEHGLPEENIHAMPTSEDAAHPAAGAEMYAQELEAYAPEGGIEGPNGSLNMPEMDIMLLGVGPDGHINSLFPGKESLSVTGQSTTGESDAPPQLGPPMRVTLTFDAVHTAKRVWTAVAGQDKADAAAKAFVDSPDISEVPAANARGTHQTVWHLDRAAAEQLPQT
ncbi:6-phosphogluconolactonase [Nesterenkonia salmonea]|uniref:6-phosphogluconolactonase n=1 Tax=Nesterenkonia salmonea TaxID=1804987 RepID=A0A5R9BDX3_9MICC|nr:6-phosphogluconolactonase [Nesterenkonia salmonea]TLP98845.1 6-phosphogluconolactonase [Nesterenkonia salmonea]